MMAKRWVVLTILICLLLAAGALSASAAWTGVLEAAADEPALGFPALVATSTASAPLGEAVRVAELGAWGADRAHALAFSPDGRWLAVASSIGLYLYDAQTLAEIRFMPTDTWVRSVAFSPAGDLLVTGSYDASVRLWRPADGTLLRTLEGHTSWVRSVAFSPDGDTLATASDDHTVRLWSAASGALLKTLTAGMQGVRTVAFSPDGELLATGGYDNLIRLWRVADASLVRALPGHAGWVRSLAFSPDGQTLASGAFDATARLWRVADGTLLHTLEAHTASVLSVAFSPAGDRLATGSVDTTVRLWQVADGAPLGELIGHDDFVFAVAFSPSGRSLVSGAVDNTIRLWPLTDEILAVAAEEAARIEDHAAGSNCVICHHPHGDLREPGVVGQPARVIEAGCSLCHADGSLVFNWCPSLPRVSTPATVSVAPPAVSAEIGVPRGTRNLSVVMSTPGNEEHWYASGEMISLVLVNGRVEYTGSLSDLTVRLEIWSGSERLDELSTPPAADGSFTFGINLNPEGSLLVLPIDLLDCLPCHDRDRELATIVLSGSNYTDVSLSGRVRLAIVATTPKGDHATDERWINVDRSRDLTVPVLTFLDGDPAQPVHDLRVEASTVLYEWRARVFAGTTDATGTASIPLEVLAEVPTRYTFGVPPTVVDGVRYESIAPVELTLPAGAASAEPVVLAVRAQTGAITGRLAGAVSLPGAGLPVHAIRLPEGATLETQTEAAGLFAFADVPVDQYLIVADTAALAGQGLSGAAQTIDLAQAPQAEVVVALTPLEGHTLQGVVLDSQGEPLPFAWLSVGEAGFSRPVSPGTGAWALRGVPADSRSVVAVAPGYYSQARALPDEVGQAGALDFHLVERPDMQRLAWGSGELRVPPETRATLADRQISLASGWLWGTGDGGQSGTIETAGVVIEVPGGLFALENQPGQSAWFYLFEGTAEAYRAADPARRVYLAAGQMLALTASGELAAVPLDPVVMQALHPGARAPLPAIWEPNLEAQVRDRLALLGVTTAQVVTFATYSLSIAALATLPVAGAIWWRRRAHPAHQGA